MNTLVLSAGKTTLEAAFRDREIPVYLASSYPNASHYVNDRMFLSITSWSDYEQLEQVARALEGKIDKVETVDEACVRAAGFIRDLLGLPGLSFRDAVGFTDKYVMKQKIARHGIATARNRVVHHHSEIDDFASEVGWPIIVKPRSGFGSVNTFKVESSSHLSELVSYGAFSGAVSDPTSGVFEAIPEITSPLEDASAGMLLEEFIEVKREIFCDVIRYNGENVIVAPGFYNQPMMESEDGTYSGTLFEYGSSEYNHFGKLISDCADALGLYTGFMHCEVLQDSEGRCYFGEAGHRPGGGAIGHATSRSYGYDIQQVMVDLSMDRKPDLEIGRQPYPGLSCIQLYSADGVVSGFTKPDEMRIKFPNIVDMTISLEIGKRYGGSMGTAIGSGFIWFLPEIPESAVAEMDAMLNQFSINYSE